MTLSDTLVTARHAYFTREAVAQIAETPVSDVAVYFAGRSGDNALVRVKAT
ncbi:hypothetical protein [Streptomyces sp. B4I13]|uniref:hypothetical protein n=1 Tax=Streptomyces sp. B4I13 TaxID=3042271 RepID=UPI0027D86E82|nr:hypothetical protein [Streptomyces sp. B4I13]